MVQLNVKKTCIYKQLFKSANSISLSNGNPSCILNIKTANNKNRNNNLCDAILSQVFLRDLQGRQYNIHSWSCRTSRGGNTILTTGPFYHLMEAIQYSQLVLQTSQGRQYKIHNWSCRPARGGNTLFTVGPLYHLVKAIQY